MSAVVLLDLLSYFSGVGFVSWGAYNLLCVIWLILSIGILLE
jgi:hypothetical protein